MSSSVPRFAKWREVCTLDGAGVDCGAASASSQLLVELDLVILEVDREHFAHRQTLARVSRTVLALSSRRSLR
jgi:hypothetical protein